MEQRLNRKIKDNP